MLGKNFRRSTRQQAGDTIVEVLIAVAVISLVLAGAYASTNHNVRAMQDTQEHAQALQLAQTQVEFLRARGAPAGACYDNAGNSTAVAACVFNADGTLNPTAVEPAFKLSISAPDAAGVYAVSAQWDSLLGTNDNVTLYYRPAS